MVKFSGQFNATGQQFTVTQQPSAPATEQGSMGPTLSTTQTPSMSTAGSKGRQMQTQKLRESYQHMAANVIKHGQEHDAVTADWPALRLYFHDVFESASYSMSMGFVIVTNAILVIHETDLRASNTPMPTWLAVVSYIFLGIYIIEILTRLYVWRRVFFKSGWNVIDLLVVITDICAEISKVWAASANAPSVSILRIFRLARLLRLIAMLSFSAELQTMLLGFGSAMKAMVWASLMIGGVITVCSIIAVEFIHPLNVEVNKTGVYGECRRCGRAFETVAESNLTFIQQIIAGDSWGKITIPIIENYPGAGVFFLVVFGLIDLGVLNLILTVIVNAAESARETNHEMQLRAKARSIEEMKGHLKDLCAALDHDEDGRISLEEFCGGADTNEEFARTLALLDIQKQDAEIVYNLMDEDGSGDVDYNEFVHTMISTKHDSTTTKLLFLQAGIGEVQKELRMHTNILSEELVGSMVQHLMEQLVGAIDVSRAVNKAFDESSAKMSVLPDRVMNELQAVTREFQTLTRQMNQRWEVLHSEQAKTYRVLEKVLAETHQLREQSSQRGSARLSPLASISMPQACTPCEIGLKQSRIIPESSLLSGLQSQESRVASRMMGSSVVSASLISASDLETRTPQPGDDFPEGTRTVVR